MNLKRDEKDWSCARLLSHLSFHFNKYNEFESFPSHFLKQVQKNIHGGNSLLYNEGDL